MKKAIKAIYLGLLLLSVMILTANPVFAATPNPEPIKPSEELYPTYWLVGMILVICVLVAPWIYVLFKYGIFRKLRISFIVDENIKINPIYLKKGSKITLPKDPEKEGFTFKGWYLDQEFTEEFIDIPMPDYNFKLYAKFEEN